MTAATKKQTAVDDVSVSGVSDSWNVCVTQLMDVIWRWIIYDQLVTGILWHSNREVHSDMVALALCMCFLCQVDIA